MKTSLTLAIGLCTASTVFAANNDDPRLNTDADTPLIAHPVEAIDLMAEDNTLNALMPPFKLGDEMSVTWGGRIMFDNTLITADSTHPAGTEDGSEFRRARLYAKVEISKHVSGKVQYDFVGQDVDFKDVYIKFKTEYGGIIVGHHFQPVSLEALTSSRFITFIERSMAVEAFAPGRDSGVSTSNKFNENTHWSLGFFRPVDNSGGGTGDGDYSVAGRVTHSIERGDSTFHMGLSTSISGSRDVTRVRSRPEVHQAGRVIDSTAGTSDSSMLVGLEFAWTSGPNTIQAEYIMNSVDKFDTGAGSEDVDFNGYYISYSRMLTGESRSYNKAGKWNRIHPNENWEGKGLNGAWEAAARYSVLDLTDGSFDQEATGITVGMNWYMNPNTRIMVNVVRSEADLNGVDGDFTALLARFQVDW